MNAADCDPRTQARVEMYSALGHMAAAITLLHEAGDTTAWTDALAAHIATRNVLNGMLDKDLGRTKEAEE